MTNADRIRNMTDEELMELLDEPLEFFSCDECEKPGLHNMVECCSDCTSWILRYLQKNV